jgi:hypothetical protein
MFSVVATEPPVPASRRKTRRDQGFLHGAAIGGPDDGRRVALLAIGAIPTCSRIEVDRAIHADPARTDQTTNRPITTPPNDPKQSWSGRMTADRGQGVTTRLSSRNMS